MGLITCVECNGKVSDRAEACPHCGCPVAIANSKARTLSPTQLHSEGLPSHAVSPAVQRSAKTSSTPPVVAASPTIIAEPGGMSQTPPAAGNPEDKIGCLADSFWLVLTIIIAIAIIGGVSLVFGESLFARDPGPRKLFSVHTLRTLFFLLLMVIAMIPYMRYRNWRQKNRRR